MPLRLEVVKHEDEFPELARVLYASFGEPYNSLRQWFIPIHTTVDAAIADFSARLVKGWKMHADKIHWVKVVDDTGNGDPVVIGAAEWEVRPKIEGVGEPQAPITAYWHLDGSEDKEFCGKLLTSLKGFMKAHMIRPHVGKAPSLVGFRGQEK
jgi:hypothetical protein